MYAELELLFVRARARLAAAAWEKVPGRDQVCLEAELGRPLPRLLARTWRSLGAARLAALGIWSPRSISDGLPMAERWLDEGLLPFASTRDGDSVLLRLAGYLGADDDPDVVLAVDFPRRLQVEVGRLSRFLAAQLLVHLAWCAADEHERRAVAARLDRLDPDGRLRDPLGWGERVARTKPA